MSLIQKVININKIIINKFIYKDNFWNNKRLKLNKNYFDF